MMICHYEVLGLPLDCKDDEIKKTYRRLALLYHPDKNPEDHEECTKKFLSIQQAYEVLIDPQERAWYDKHRNAILKGGLGKGDTYEDKSLDVYQYFNTGCYSGFDDGPKSFYSVYANVFKLISEEDVEYMEQQSDLKLAPEFGNSQSSYNDVVGEFYAHWESYNTLKTYVWVEKYDTRDAPNRQIRRMMEQDNKKLRDAAKKERNEQIRTLVAFVKKRDKRVELYNQQLRDRAAEVNKRVAENKEQNRLQRIKKMEEYKETGWSATSELENQLRSLELDLAKQFSEDDDELYSSEAEVAEDEKEVDEDVCIDDTFCVACNKSFKSVKAMENHCNSKKHQEKIALLIENMRSEDAGHNSDQSDDLDSVTENTNISKSRSKKQKKKRRKLKLINAEEKDCESQEEKQNLDSNIKLETADILENTIETIKKEVSVEAKSTKNKTSTEIQCNTCKEIFATRNKLFDHLKSSGHALRIEQESAVKSNNINKKTKKLKNKISS